MNYYVQNIIRSNIKWNLKINKKLLLKNVKEIIRNNY